MLKGDTTPWPYKIYSAQTSSGGDGIWNYRVVMCRLIWCLHKCSSGSVVISKRGYIVYNIKINGVLQKMHNSVLT